MAMALPPARDPADDLSIPTIVKIGGGASMVSAGFTVALALQTLLNFRLRGPIVAVLPLMGALGIAGLVTGWGSLRGRAGSVVGSTITGGLVATLGLAWAVYALLGGLVSPLSFGVVPLAVLATVVCGVAISPARRVTSARDRLRAQGLDFGV